MSQGDRQLQAILEGRPRLGPRSVHVDVIQACNARCLMCWDHSPLLTTRHPPDWNTVRLPAHRFSSLLDQLEGLGGLRDILISGQGEPFMHPEIATLVEDVKRRSLSLTLMTNLVAPLAEPALIRHADAVLVSIHGAGEQSYLALHPGWSGQHYRTLRDRLDVLARSGMRVKHVQVITRHNAHDLPEMVRLAAETSAARITFKLASLRHGTESCGVDDDQRRWLLEEGIVTASALARALGVSSNLDVLEMQLAAGGRNTSEPTRVPCSMGYVYARVLAEESVLYCCNTALRVGSLGDASFAQLWWGDTWNALRDSLRKGIFPSGCEQCGKLEQNVKWAKKLARLAASSPPAASRRKGAV